MATIFFFVLISLSLTWSLNDEITSRYETQQNTGQVD